MRVSIIIPVYNVEKYLRTCLDSVVNQTWQDVEGIVVDDASPDNSREIIKEYERRYPNKIKGVYLDENLCLGGARNKGLDVATGDYVTYLDSDDYLDVTMCEKLVNKAKETDADLVYCDAYRNFEGMDKKVWVSYQFAKEMGDVTEEKRTLLMFNYGYAWGKLIRNSILTDNNIYFPAHKKYEDILFIPLVMQTVQRVAYVQEPLYYYLIRDNSIMTTRNTEHHKDMAYVGDLLYTEMTKRGLIKARELMKAISYYKAVKIIIDKNDEPDVEFIYDLAKKTDEFYHPAEMIRYIAHEPMEIAIVETALCSKDKLEEKVKNGYFVESNVDYKPYYKVFAPCINRILDGCKNKKVAIWGYGKKGGDLLDIIRQMNKSISYVIDKNKELHGRILDTGERIVSYHEICGKIDVIIVVNRNYYSAIESEIRDRDKGVEIINLEEEFLIEAVNEM